MDFAMATSSEESQIHNARPSEVWRPPVGHMVNFDAVLDKQKQMGATAVICRNHFG